MSLSRLPTTLLATAALGALASAQFSFAPAVDTFVGNQPEGVALADLDGDGDLDAAVTVDQPDRVAILTNAGDGTLAVTASVPTGGGTSPHAITAADMDGDGDLDLAVTLKGVDQVRVVRNDGGVFALAASAGVGVEPRGLAAGDLDGDGDVDLATSNRDGSSASVLLNDGAGNLTASTFGVGPDPRGVAIGRFDGDGDLDLAVSSSDARRIDLFLNDGTGGFTPGPSISLGPQLRPEDLVALDLDADGDDDIATAASGGGLNVAAVTLQTSPGVFSAPASFAVGGLDPSDIAAGDLDVDGDPDLVTSNADSNTVSLLPNTGSGSFGGATTLAVGVGPQAVAIGDLDGNGAPDIAVTNNDTDDLSVLINGLSGSAFVDVGSALAGTNGTPSLAGEGTLEGGTAFSLTASTLRANEPLTLVVGLSLLNAPFKGGTMVPALDFLLPLVTDGAGSATLAATWPAGVPAGTLTAWQAWQADPAGPNGFAATNALQAVTP